jgi:hypothetical protein
MSMRNLAFHEIARNPYESAAPELWPAHAWIPALGIQGGVLFDVAGGNCAWLPNALSFNGTSSYATVANVFTGVTTKKLTFTARLKLNNTTATQVLLEASANYNTNDGALLFYVDAGYIYLGIQDSVGSVTPLYIVARAAAPTDGLWHRYALIIDNSTVAGHASIYIDGFPVSTITKSDKDNSSAWHDSPLYIGARNTNTLRSNFHLSNLCLYHRILPQPDILALSSDPLLPFRRREIKKFWIPVGGGTTIALTGAASISSADATAGTATADQIIPQELSGAASISTSDATAGAVVAGASVSIILDGAASVCSADATQGTATANQVIPKELTGAASISSANATAGTAVSGSTIPQALSGAASISSSESVAGSVTANKSYALSGPASVSESPSTAGTVTVNQIIAQTLTGAASLSGGISTPGTVITGSIVPQTLAGTESASAAEAIAGSVTVEQIIDQALSGTLSVSEAPAQVGTLTLGVVLSGESSISDVFATAGRVSYEGFFEPQELTGAASASLSEANAGIAYWGKEIGPYSASRARVVSAKYQAILRSQKYNATRR